MTRTVEDERGAGDMGSWEPADIFGTPTMGAMIVEALARHPHRTAFVDGQRSVTYAEVEQQVGVALARFESLGLGMGDVVAQLSGNRFEVWAIIAAAYIAGLRSVTLHPSGGEQDHRFILEESGARLLIVDRPYVERAADLARTGLESIACFAHDGGGALPGFWEAMESFSPAPLTPRGGPERIIRLAYTGGTTGRPKGVMLSNRSLAANTLMALAGLDWPDEVRFLCPAPISHGAGSFILPALWRGGCIILQQGFEAGSFLAAVEQHKATMSFLVPTMIYALLDHPALERADCSSLHSLIYGAAPMIPARTRQAIDRLGPILVQCYGQTEAPNAILTMRRCEHLRGDDRRLRAAGRPFPGIQVKLLDPAGAEVPLGAAGELCVRGPLVMSGYWRRAGETAEALRGGWLHTGDIAVCDEEGFYSLVDRQKDVIISGGFNIFPGEIERTLAEHPAVMAAAVIGIPDEKWGEAVKAVVVRRPGHSVRESELVALVRARKGPIQAPKSLEFADALPLTALGKIDKKAIRARYWSGADRAIH